ncbi:MAG: hypothetical protein K2Q18_14620 [Bdellovibrionales bacterium]|nr:hypothetical protein [Bdellovibrionales bacterium]
MKNQSSVPRNFKEDIFEMSWNFDKDKCQIAWDKLQLRETFVKGQIPPYKVEFDSSTQFGAFATGELNIHHGPFLSVHGAVGEISSNYRDLQYFYGSYVLSFRLVRPVRLEFIKTDTSIKVRLTSYVHPMFRPYWQFGLNFFWKTFGISF